MTESSIPRVMFSHPNNHSLLFILFLFLITSGSGHDEECGSYDPYSPPIRFPFQLVKGMKDRRCYSGLCLYRTDENQIMLELPTISGPLKFLVKYIFYDSQEIRVSDPENCLPEKFLKLYNSSIHPFQLGSDYQGSYGNISFFNCSSLGRRHLRNEYQFYPDPQDMISCPIYTANFNESVLKLDLTSCTMMFGVVSSVDSNSLRLNFLTLNWSKPNCTVCEAKGKKCKWKKNSTKGAIECVDCKVKQKQTHIPKSFIFAASGSILLGLVLIGIFHVYRYFRKKEEDNNLPAYYHSECLSRTRVLIKERLFILWMTESGIPRVMFSHPNNHSLLFILFLFLITSASCHDEECGSYDPYSPPIRFPFQLVKGMKDRWCYSGFCLYRPDKNQIMLELPTISGPLKFYVYHISYDSQEIHVSDPENCLPEKFLKLYNSSIHPFQFGHFSDGLYNISFFNCSSLGHRHLRNEYQLYPDSQDMISCPIYAVDSDDSLLLWDLVSCTKMFDVISSQYPNSLQNNYLSLSWSKPNCTVCEAKGKKCKWKNNSTEGVIECVDCKGKRKQIHIPKSFIFAASSSILLGLVLIGIFHVYGYFRKKEEDNIRVEKFLEDYRAQKPTRFSYADIKRITGGFKEKLGEGAHGAVFKGKLSNEILVAVKILNNAEGEGKEFINEVGIMGKIHHINVVRLLGFCAEGLHRILVYNFFPNGSLQNFISSPDNNDRFLNWEKLQQIALGIVKGIEYLHQGCSHPILHFDINPHNVLLDENFTPKISDFGLAKLCSKNFSAVSLTAARGTLGYIAPEVFSRNFGNVSYKSDIYSYGMLLLEMVGGRKNIDMSSGQTFQVLYPEWIHNLLEGGDIHIHIEDEGDNKIVKKLAIVGLWCIQWQPVNRPSIKTVVQMLETEDENLLKVPPNPFGSTTSTGTSEINLARLPLELEVIQE